APGAEESLAEALQAAAVGADPQVPLAVFKRAADGLVGQPILLGNAPPGAAGREAVQPAADRAEPHVARGVLVGLPDFEVLPGARRLELQPSSAVLANPLLRHHPESAVAAGAGADACFFLPRVELNLRLPPALDEPAYEALGHDPQRPLLVDVGEHAAQRVA